MVAVKAKVLAERVVGADVAVHAVSDAGHPRRLPKVIPVPARPHQHIVSQVAYHAVGLLDRGCEAAPDRRDVFVVPRVAVGDGCPVADAGDLVAIVPPR